jgi:protease IV
MGLNSFRRGCMLFASVLASLAAAGCGAPSFLITPVANSNSLDEEVVKPGKGWARDKIAIVEVEGMLMNIRAGGLLQATENKLSLFTQEMEKAASDPSVKAVVLRVNSPGGTVTASDIMYQTVRDFREKTGKPVVASTQEVAASGGYYVCLASDRIVAHPTSVIGSIGVIFETMEFEGTLGKLGIRAAAIKSGPMKDMGSPFRAMLDPERKVMQEMVDEYYARFVALVKQRRERVRAADSETLRVITDGRVFTGERAVALGLADQNGLLDDAIDLAKELADAPGAKVVAYHRPYGYGGSIYARDPAPPPQANVLHLGLPTSRLTLPGGFYYLWEPGI